MTAPLVKPRFFEYAHLVAQEQQEATVAEIVGRNVRRLRGDRTADELARAARRQGLKWSSGRVSELEAGKVSPTLPTLFALAAALGDMSDKAVSLAQLVESDGFIRVNDELVVKADTFATAVGSAPVQLTMGDLSGGVARAVDAVRKMTAELSELPDYLRDMPVTDARETMDNIGEAEARIAKGLGISALRMRWESAYLWRNSFSAERDRRAGPDANAQKRGRVSRELKAELRASISRGDN